MVIGHSGTTDYIKSFIYLFHIPAFYFVSGYFFNDKYVNDKITYTKRRFFQLYQPFIVYGIIFLILSPLFHELHIINKPISTAIFIRSLFTTLIFQHVETLLDPFWFLRSLFTVSLLFLIIRWLNYKIIPSNNLFTIVICITLFAIGAILGTKNIHLPAQIQREFVVLLFFASGYFSKALTFSYYKNRFLIIGAFILLCILAHFIRIDLVSNYFNSIWGLVVGSLLGIYFLITLSKYLTKHSIASKFLSYIGRNTISILALHFLSFKFVSILLILLYQFPISSLSHWPTINNTIISQSAWWILYSITGIILPLCYSLIAKQIKTRLITKRK